MSVYSGFATRLQQNKYNSLTQNLIVTLKTRIIKFYKEEPCDEDKFKLLVKKIFKKMFILEKAKFMLPKYTNSFTDLIQSLNIQINLDNLSQSSSVLSQTLSPRNDLDGEQEQGFKSKFALKTKKNNLEALAKNRVSFESVARKLSTLDTDIRNSLNPRRSESLGNEDKFEMARIKPHIRIKQFKSLNESRMLRGPKTSSLIQKKQESEGLVSSTERTIGKEMRSFRRRKYSKTDLIVQEM